MNAQRPRSRLYLFSPQLDDTTSFASALDAILTAGDVAAVLLRLADADERTLINRAKSIGAVVQRRDIALLLDGRSDIVGRAGADGAHLTGIEALRGALGSLKPDRIAGVGSLRSRHDAMLAAEANPDYVMFGEPDRRGNQTRRPEFSAIVERVEWWAELFQLPCIGYAAAADEIRPLAEAGADFVALGEWIWQEPGGAETAVAAAADNIVAAGA